MTRGATWHIPSSLRRFGASNGLGPRPDPTICSAVIDESAPPALPLRHARTESVVAPPVAKFVPNVTHYQSTGLRWWQPGFETLRRPIFTRLLTGLICGRWQRPQPVEVSERGGPCPESGHFKLSLLNPADCPEVPDRVMGQGLRNKLRLAQTLTPASHGCVFSCVALRSVTMRPCIYADASWRIATQRMKNASMWGGGNPVNPSIQ